MAQRKGIQTIFRYAYRHQSSPFLYSISANQNLNSPSPSENLSSRTFSTFFLQTHKTRDENATASFSSHRNYSVQASMQTSMPSFSNFPSSKDKAYARNLAEYNQAMISLCKRRKTFLLREVYYDMLLDGVQPNRDTFQIAIPGCMRGSKLQDAFYFFNEMKANGLVPDLVLYNSIISTCGRCLQVERAFQIAEEMEAMGIQPKFRTFVALLNACGLAGRVNEAYGIVKRMTLSGMAMNKYCYSALISAYKNRRPFVPDTINKIFELLEQSKEMAGNDENFINAALGVNDDLEFAEEQGLATDILAKRGFLNRNLIVYHAALRAMVDLRNREGVNRVLDLMEKDGLNPDAFTYTQIMKINLGRYGELDKALEAFNNFLSIGASPTLELYLTLIEGCIKTYSDKGMDSAKKLLTEMLDRGYFLNPKMGSELLALAAREIGGDYSTASLFFDVLVKTKRPILLRSIISFARGLLRRGVPESDPRIVKAQEIINSRITNFNLNINNVSGSSNNTNVAEETEGEGEKQEELDDHVQVHDEIENGEDGPDSSPDGQFEVSFHEKGDDSEAGLEKPDDFKPQP